MNDEEFLDEGGTTQPLVTGVFECGTVILLHSDSGAGKTFLATDLGFCIASGVEWHGHPVTRGSVVYVAGEGQPGLRQRIRAWKQHRRMTGNVIGVYILREAIDPLDRATIDAFLARLRALPTPPILVVFDTWSACLSVGEADEDRAKDVGRAIAALRRIVAEFGASVLILHHEGNRSKGRARGSTALKAAADTVLALTATKGGLRVLSNPKQRDMDSFQPTKFRLERVSWDGGESCVLVSTEDDELDAQINAVREQHDRTERILAVLRGFPEGARCNEWLKATGLSETTFLRERKALLEARRVEQVGSVYRVADDDTAANQHLQPTTTGGSGGAEPEDIHHQPPPHPVGVGVGGDGGAAALAVAKNPRARAREKAQCR